MPFASIHHIFMEINSLKFGQKHFTIPRFPAKKGYKHDIWLDPVVFRWDDANTACPVCEYLN